MAAYARLYSSVWKTDFTGLSHGAQWLYVALISQPDISNAGVLALTRGRWGTLSSDTDADSVQAFLDELADDDKVICDSRTEEVWVRSYMRYDGLAKANPNGLTSVRRAVAAILSPTLRQLADNELATVAEGVDEGVDRTGSSPQQPRAASRGLHPRPAAAATALPELPAAAAAAINIAIEHEVMTSSKPVRRYDSFAKTVRERLLREHGTALHTEADDGRDDRWLAQHVLGLTAGDVITAAVKLRERSAS